MSGERSCEQNNPTMTNTENIPEQPVRINLVNTAAEFLVSPSVQSSSMDMKVAFLKKKGLTDSEVDLAIKQSDARLMAIRENAGISSVPPGQMQMLPLYHPPSRWTLARDIANSAVLIAGFCYGAYWAYHNFIVPYFFGKKDKKSVESRLKDIDQTMSTCLADIGTNVGKLREDLEKTADRRTGDIHREINELKTEISSLKKLLLNRKQFPSAGGMAPLSIPSWQISESEEKQQTPDEEGTGSNGSESSLEMIKE